MIYLLKVTVAWTLFLLLFEAFYKSNGKFAANRFYLLFSIVAGLLLPLIPMPSNAPAIVSTTQIFYPTALSAAHGVTATSVTTPSIVVATAATNGLNVWLILQIIYGIGVAFLALKILLEFIRMMRLVVRHPYQIIAGHKVIITGKSHAPYSFMGWIFVDDLNAYQPGELAYIILHEAAHNKKKHWLDLLLLQFACIILWFHPLIWRYRYQLKLQHEYEADDVAARNDSYAYGHFLLQQTLLNGVPSIAHSFHFSPIKNRIKMLTKKQNQRPGAWKYFLVIPALLGCTFLMAKNAANANNERIKTGNVIFYNGNEFKWHAVSLRNVDINSKERIQVIYEMNGATVYQNEDLQNPATFAGQEMEFVDYIQTQFAARRKNIADSTTAIMVNNIVIDKEGKIAYYELHSIRPYTKQKYWYPYGNQDPLLNPIMEKIIAESPRWKPATINGLPVNSVLAFRGC